MKHSAKAFAKNALSRVEVPKTIGRIDATATLPINDPRPGLKSFVLTALVSQLDQNLQPVSDTPVAQLFVLDLESAARIKQAIEIASNWVATDSWPKDDDEAGAPQAH